MSGDEMNLSVSSKTIGEMVANQNHIQEMVSSINEKVDDLKDFKSRTDERLKNGIDTFININSRIDKANDIINLNSIAIVKIEAAIPSKKVLYSMITIGFIVLAFLISFFSLMNRNSETKQTPVSVTQSRL